MSMKTTCVIEGSGDSVGQKMSHETTKGIGIFTVVLLEIKSSLSNHLVLCMRCEKDRPLVTWHEIRLNGHFNLVVSHI